MKQFKLTKNELETLRYRAIVYNSRAAQALTLHTYEQALEDFKKYHHYLGDKYGYDPTKAKIAEDGTVTIPEDA